MNKKHTHHAGFTLVELQVAFALFTIVALVVLTVILGMMNATRKIHAIKSTMDSVSAAMESMTRSIRVGTSYDCSGSPAEGDTNDCPNGENTFGYVSSSGGFIIYRLNAGRIERCGTGVADCAGTYVAITPPDVTISNLDFYVQGSALGDNEQPHATIVIEGRAGITPKYTSTFVIQTTVTQRYLDI